MLPHESKSVWSLWDSAELSHVQNPLWKQSSVALGTFDGVHLGHQSILKTAVSKADDLGLTPIALTFDRHPLETLADERKPPLLTSLPRKVQLILDQGITHVVVIRFTPEFSQTDANEFVEQILVGGLGAKAVTVGFDFKFGRGATGNPQLLKRFAPEQDFQLTVIPAVTHQGQPLSSTKIRSMLLSGAVSQAASMLGYPYRLEGYVIHGDGRGRTIGFPTANMEIQDGLLIPADGVYATVINDVQQALTVIGTRPSFDGFHRTVENFILDFSGDLYGQWLNIDFYERIRDVVRFGSADQLVAQIERDVQAARRYFTLGRKTCL